MFFDGCSFPHNQPKDISFIFYEIFTKSRKFKCILNFEEREFFLDVYSTSKQIWDQSHKICYKIFWYIFFFAEKQNLIDFKTHFKVIYAACRGCSELFMFHVVGSDVKLSWVKYQLQEGKYQVWVSTFAQKILAWQHTLLLSFEFLTIFHFSVILSFCFSASI